MPASFLLIVQISLHLNLHFSKFLLNLQAPINIADYEETCKKCPAMVWV
jgi:hypothetical protein